MTFDLDQLLTSRRGENFELYSKYVNPQLVRVLRSVGMDRTYVRGEGAYLYDDAGKRYLDFLAGFGAFGLGRSHPVIKSALHRAIDLTFRTSCSSMHHCSRVCSPRKSCAVVRRPWAGCSLRILALKP